LAFTLALFVTALLLAYANGANDNFKGVATLFGSRSTSYRTALIWANMTTFAGAATAVLLFRALLAAFSGKGIVPDGVAGQGDFLLAVGAGAALTVLLATRLGFPISTTHALVGGITGAGLVAAGAAFSFEAVVRKFFLALLISPFLAAAATYVLYPVFRAVRARLHVTRASCLCVGEAIIASEAPAPATEAGMALTRTPTTRLTVTIASACPVHGGAPGDIVRLRARPVLNGMHFLSAGAVCFSRGLNDAPKIAAIAAGAAGLDPRLVILIVGVAMVVGGVLGARRVAHTMSERITTMNDGQGFTSNLVTAILGIGVSRLGLPMSTTHVSCGALFGLGAVTGGARTRMIMGILLAWLITLPVGAAFAAAAYGVISVF